MTTFAQRFVRDYALNCYTFDGEDEDYLVAKLIYRYMRGRRVLDLGCGPVAPVLAVFYPNAKEALAVDRLQENLSFAKSGSTELADIIDRAKRYRYRYLSPGTNDVRLTLMRADVTTRLNIGAFDAVMQVGCFGALDTNEQFRRACQNAYAYLRPGGTLLMINWLDERRKVRRPFHFNGRVDSLALYRPCLTETGFVLKEIHTTSRLSADTKSMGYDRIVWAVARKPRLSAVPESGHGGSGETVARRRSLRRAA